MIYLFPCHDWLKIFTAINPCINFRCSFPVTIFYGFSVLEKHATVALCLVHTRDRMTISCASPKTLLFLSTIEVVKSICPKEACWCELRNADCSRNTIGIYSTASKIYTCHGFVPQYIESFLTGGRLYGVAQPSPLFIA